MLCGVCKRCGSRRDIAVGTQSSTACTQTTELAGHAHLNPTCVPHLQLEPLHNHHDLKSATLERDSCVSRAHYVCRLRPDTLLQRRIIHELPVDGDFTVRCQRLYPESSHTMPFQTRVPDRCKLALLHRHEHLVGVRRKENGRVG